MNADEIVVIAGSPRCGSSLMMRMLYVAGVDVMANLGLQSFEDSRAGMQGSLTVDFMRLCQGKAVKVLDPHRNRLPESFRYRIVWLERDLDEQSKSMFKFLRACGIPVIENRGVRRRFARSIQDDAQTFWRHCLPRLDASMHLVRFERLLADPETVAASVARFLARELDIRKMAAVVIPRSPACLPGMLELSEAVQ